MRGSSCRDGRLARRPPGGDRVRAQHDVADARRLAHPGAQLDGGRQSGRRETPMSHLGWPSQRTGAWTCAGSIRSGHRLPAARRPALAPRYAHPARRVGSGEQCTGHPQRRGGDHRDGTRLPRGIGLCRRRPVGAARPGRRRRWGGDDQLFRMARPRGRLYRQQPPRMPDDRDYCERRTSKRWASSCSPGCCMFPGCICMVLPAWMGECRPSHTLTGHNPAAVASHLPAQGIFAWSGHFYAVEVIRNCGRRTPCFHVTTSGHSPLHRKFHNQTLVVETVRKSVE